MEVFRFRQQSMLIVLTYLGEYAFQNLCVGMVTPTPWIQHLRTYDTPTRNTGKTAVRRDQFDRRAPTSSHGHNTLFVDSKTCLKSFHTVRHGRRLQWRLRLEIAIHHSRRRDIFSRCTTRNDTKKCQITAQYAQGSKQPTARRNLGSWWGTTTSSSTSYPVKETWIALNSKSLDEERGPSGVIQIV